MKYAQQTIITLISVLAMMCSGCKSTRIEITNTGDDILEITDSNSDMTTKLGQNGTAYFDENSEIYIGETVIRIIEK